MRVFVTGASGFIGAAVTQELISHGYEVVGLARNDASANKITSLGGTALKGDLLDLDSLKKGAAAADAVIHLAFVHDFSSPESTTRNCEIDRNAIASIGEAISGTDKVLIIASGTLGLARPNGEPGTEDTPAPRGSGMFERVLSSDLVMKLSREQSIRGMVVRLPPIVHEGGRGGFLEILPPVFRQAGYAAYVNDGTNRWPAGNVRDVAVLFRLAMEKGRAAAIYHASVEDGVPTKDIVESIGRKLGLPIESKHAGEVADLGIIASLLAMDGPVSSKKTQRELVWQPTHPGLLADIESGKLA